MILKPIAKPVRIRIKSGGMEHSSVESLKSHFVVDDIKDLVADGRLSRWLEQQNHRSIPDEIIALNKDSMEFELAVYRFFFDENKAKSNGELYYSLYRETNNEAFLLKSAEELFPKALIELDERRKAEKEARRRAEEETRRKAEEEARRKAEEEARRKAEEEARRKAEEEVRRRAEEEARNKKEEYLMIGKGRYVKFYKDCGDQSKWANVSGCIDNSSYRILTHTEWAYLVEHCNTENTFYKEYRGEVVFYKDTRGFYKLGVVGHGRFTESWEHSYGRVLLFKDVKILVMR